MAPSLHSHVCPLNGAGKRWNFRGIESHISVFRGMNTSSRRGFIFVAGLLLTASPAQAFFFTETSNESFLAIMAMCPQAGHKAAGARRAAVAPAVAAPGGMRGGASHA